MTQKTIFRFIFSAIAAALILPQIIFAQTLEEAALDAGSDYPRLSQWEAQKILKDLLPQVLTNQWMEDIVRSDKDRFYGAIPLTLRSFINYNFSHYLLNDVPLDVAKTITIQSIEIGKIVFAGDYNSAFAEMLKKLEKESVKKAIEYIKSEFFKYQIKLSAGAFEVQYQSEQGAEKTLIQYIIVCKDKDNGQTDASIRIYSIEAINPPASKKSAGGLTGISHSLYPGEQIPPFVATFSGAIKKDQHGGFVYSWLNQPQIDISFPADVTDLGLRPKSWWERNIIDPIKSFFDDPLKKIGSLFGAQIFQTATNQPEDQDSKEDSLTEEFLSANLKDVIAGQLNSENPLSALNPATEASNGSAGLQNSNIATGSQQQSGQSESGATTGAPSNSQSAVAVTQNQLTPQEQQQAINSILQELARRQQSQTEEENQALKQGLIFIVQELAKRSGQPANINDGSDDGSDSDSESKDSDDNGDNKDSNEAEEKSVLSGAADYCEYQSGQAPLSSQIIINEVAWMGTSASASHEWIELKNLTGQTINLSGWQLQDKGAQIKIVFGSDIQIPANQMILLERTSDETVPGIKADLIYKGALSNTNEALYLFGPDCSLQDKVEALPNWPAGSDSPKKTMERGSNLSWHTYSGSGQNSIFGTPKAENSLPVVVYSGGGSSASGQQSQSQSQSQNSNSTSTQNTDIEQQSSQIDMDEPETVNHLIITEVQLGDELGREYVELYNPADNDIALCPDLSGSMPSYYFSYYPANREWNDPYRSKSFCDSPAGENAFVPAKGYYLISFNNWPEEQSDWPIYVSGILSDTEGAVAIFSDNPKNATGTVEEIETAISAVKIDVFGWKKEEASSGPIVKETEAAVVPAQAGKVLGRLWHNASKKYQDTDNNAKDFEVQNPNPKSILSFAPEAIENLSIQKHPNQKNGARLSWFAPNDLDTLPELLEYKVFFVRNKDPLAENFEEIKEAGLNISKQGEEATAIITDLYYDSSYYFSVQAFDDNGNSSPLSDASPVFAIDAAIHPWPMAKHDSGITRKADFAGPVGGQTSIAFADLTGEFFAPPIIDENQAVYFFGKINGQTGFFAFDSQGQNKWFFNISSANQIPALSPDGMFYFFAPFGVGALNPAGQLKWKESFSAIYTANPLVGLDSRLYLIAKTDSQDVPRLLALSDGGDKAIKEIDYDLAQELGQEEIFASASGPVLDSFGNIYFSVNQKLVKLNNAGLKTGEKTFEAEYSDDYKGEKNTAFFVRAPFIFGDAVIAIVGQGYCFRVLQDPEYDICREMVYSVDISDFNAENWKKPISAASDWIEPMGKEIYYAQRTPGNYAGAFLDLYAIDLATGNNSWTKHWYSQWGAPPKIYPLLIDSRNYAYFGHDSTVLGWDLNQILDSDPANGLIFSSQATHSSSNSSGAALSPAGLYVPASSKMNFIPLF